MSAHAENDYKFDLPAQALADSLRAVGSTANVNIVFEPSAVRQKKAPTLQGDYSVQEALQRLLDGSGLNLRQTDGGSFVIDGALSSNTEPGSGNDNGNGSMRLAQSEDGSSVEEAGGEDRSRIQEITVTAQKREERLIDVPISIVALGAQELTRRRVNSVDDLAMAVPGLAIQSSGSYQRRIMLRGISNIGGSSSLIGVYLDEASVTSPPTTYGQAMQLDVRTYDLERVEVLRGPQGTLYGEGSVGGTIRFITRNPQLDRFSMNADVTAYLTEDGEPGQRLEGAVNVPLIEDELGLRIAGTYGRGGGWMDQPAAGKDDFNSQNLKDVRIKGLWQPTEKFAVNAMALIHRNNEPPNVSEDADGNYTQSFGLTTIPSVKDNYDLFNLTLTYDFASARLLSSTGYIEQDKDIRHRGTRQVVGPPPLSARNDVYLTPYLQEDHNLSQELRLTSTGSGPWRWTAGGFYRRVRADEVYSGHIAPLGSPLPPVLGPFLSSAFSESRAVFGDVSYRLTDRLTLGTGLRYFEDRQEFTSGPTQSGEFDTFNPRIYAQYKLTDQVNTYASAAKGFRSGGFNQLNQPRYDPEEVWTYELGTKMLLLDGSLSTEMAIFYSDYTNYQIVGVLPFPAVPLAITRNAGNVRIKGVELGLTWRPVDQWALGLSGNYVRSEFYEITVVNSSHAVGDPLDMFPKHGYTLSAQRDFQVGGRGGFARIDYNEQGKATHRSRRIGPWYYNESDIINMLNFNASLDWSNNVSLGLFMKNILNDRGYVDPLALGDNAARARPRTFGIEFGFTFN